MTGTTRGTHRVMSVRDGPTTTVTTAARAAGETNVDSSTARATRSHPGSAITKPNAAVAKTRCAIGSTGRATATASMEACSDGTSATVIGTGTRIGIAIRNEARIATATGTRRAAPMTAEASASATTIPPGAVKNGPAATAVTNASATIAR